MSNTFMAGEVSIVWESAIDGTLTPNTNVLHPR